MYRDIRGLAHFDEDERTVVELGRLTFKGNAAKLYLPKRVCNALRLDPIKDSTFIIVAPDNSSLLLIKDSEIVEMLKPKILKLREKQAEGGEVHVAVKDTESDPKSTVKKVEIERMLEFIIKRGETGELDRYNLPNMPKLIETAKEIQQYLKNIDHLDPRMAFMVGKFKGEMEERLSRELLKTDNSESRG
jgi:hypothetical protein